MNEPNIKLIGVYKQPYTKALYEKALKLKYEGIHIPFWKHFKISNSLIKELSWIVLIEVLVENPDDRFDINDFGQPNSDQTPYDEVYLDEDGKKIISRGFDIPSSDKLRIAFFLHYFKYNKPIKTSYGEIRCPRIIKIPDRLKDIIHYEPVD